MPSPFDLSDFVGTTPCERCQRPVQLHGAPFGEPAFLLMVGFCQACSRSHLNIRASDQVTYTQSPTLQLAGMFVKLADRERHFPE